MFFWFELMNRLRDELNKSVTFVIVSDDKSIDFPQDWIVRHRGSPLEDMALLSCCDLIAGPPSTFNRWAAFAGAKRHYSAWNSDEYPKIVDFKNFKL